jgi:alkylhydroperoxidase family enzyme
MKAKIAGIATVASPDAGSELAAVYRRIAGRREPPHIYQACSLHPAAIAAHAQLYRTLMFGPSPLSRTQRELVATVVSKDNGCHY